LLKADILAFLEGSLRFFGFQFQLAALQGLQLILAKLRELQIQLADLMG